MGSLGAGLLGPASPESSGMIGIGLEQLEDIDFVDREGRERQHMRGSLNDIQL